MGRYIFDKKKTKGCYHIHVGGSHTLCKAQNGVWNKRRKIISDIAPTTMSLCLVCINHMDRPENKGLWLGENRPGGSTRGNDSHPRAGSAGQSIIPTDYLVKALASALHRLVRLKKYKRDHGPDALYTLERLEAWQGAENVLKLHGVPPEDPGAYTVPEAADLLGRMEVK